MTTQPPTYSRDIHLTLLGEPIPKLRPKTVRLKNGQSHSYTPAATTTAEDKWRNRFTNSGCPPLPPDRALAATLDFYLSRPPSAPKKRVRPATRPEIDNLTKLVTDALEGFAYENDSRIVDILASKRYVTYPDEPRTELHICTID